VAGFLFLYFAVYQLHRDALIEVYAAGAKVLLDEAIDDLHPAMEHGDRVELDLLLDRFAMTHAFQDLRFIAVSAGGVEGGPLGVEPVEQLARFLESERTVRLRLESDGQRSMVRGLVRIGSRPECTECHGERDPIAVAVVARDVTDHVEALEGRLRGTILILLSIWALMVAVSSTYARRSVRRSAAMLESDLREAESGRVTESAGNGVRGLDPATAEAHELLRRFLKRQQERRSDEVGRLHHADRLASLGEVAAGLVHEIKNPLAGVSGALEILRDRSDDAETRAVHEQMLIELERVNDTVQSLLRLSRPAKPHLAPTDVVRLVQETTTLLRPALRDRDISLDVDFSADTPSCLMDANQMQQVLVNLITNASEAIGRDGRIVVRATVLPACGGTLLAVEDDGPGISEQDLESIFEPFHSTKASGTGLGLAIAASLVHQHGGTIEVDSTPGAGSVFHVVLPASQGVRSSDASEEQ